MDECENCRLNKEFCNYCIYNPDQNKAAAAKKNWANKTSKPYPLECNECGFKTLVGHEMNTHLRKHEVEHYG